jgi:viroplasmin and RNaseH domain-containing protein
VGEDLLNQVRSGKEIKEVAKEKGYSLEETGFFTRTAGVIPKIGPAGEFMGILSSLTEKNPISKEVLRTKDGFSVVTLLAFKLADQNQFQSVKNTLENKLINQKQEEYFQNWLSQLRSKAKIDINKELP